VRFLGPSFKESEVQAGEFRISLMMSRIFEIFPTARFDIFIDAKSSALVQISQLSRSIEYVAKQARCTSERDERSNERNNERADGSIAGTSSALHSTR